jgi:hypothetical protein
MHFKTVFITLTTFALCIFSSLSHGTSNPAHQFSPNQSQPSLAKKSSLKACEKLLKSIKNYDKMRRNGGTARQMTHWKKKRAEKQKQFFAQKCTDYRQLKL